jgi:hypothetical protein
MSVYIATSEAPPAFVASNTGWGEFCRWAEHLEGAPAAAHLAAYGWTDDVEELAGELQDATGADDDVKAVAATLCGLLDGAETVVVTDGVSPGDGGSDPDSFGEDHPSPDDAPDLAEFYASLCNDLAAAGDDPGDVADEASEELAADGWSIVEDGGKWKASHESEADADEEAEKFTERAPKGGVSIGGKFFAGGKWIPNKDLANASPEDKAKLAAAKADSDTKAAGRKQERAGRGSIDVRGLQDRLAKHAGAHTLTGRERGGAAAIATLLHRHHGELALHRVEELADRVERTLKTIGDDHPNSEGLRQQFGKRLAQLHAAAERLGAKGVTGKVEKPKQAASPQANKSANPAADAAALHGDVARRLIAMNKMPPEEAKEAYAALHKDVVDRLRAMDVAHQPLSGLREIARAVPGANPRGSAHDVADSIVRTILSPMMISLEGHGTTGAQFPEDVFPSRPEKTDRRQAAEQAKADRQQAGLKRQEQERQQQAAAASPQAKTAAAAVKAVQHGAANGTGKADLDAKLDALDLPSMSPADLQGAARVLGVNASGGKAELIGRIRRSVHEIPEIRLAGAGSVSPAPAAKPEGEGAAYLAAKLKGMGVPDGPRALPASRPGKTPAEHQAAVMESIRRAGLKPGGLLSLAKLHLATGLPLADMHAAVNDLRRQGKLTGTRHESRGGLPRDVAAAALTDPGGGQIHHVSVREEGGGHGPARHAERFPRLASALLRFSEGGGSDLHRINGIELFATGNHRGVDYTLDDLKDMVRNFEEYSAPRENRAPRQAMPFVIGHGEDQSILERSDLPAAGWFKQLGIRPSPIPEDPGRYVLEGDAADVPGKVARLIRSRAYPKVSLEIYPPELHPFKGRGMMARRAAMLGGDVPQVKDLDDIPRPEPMSEPARRWPTILRFSESATVRGCLAFFSEVIDMDPEQLKSKLVEQHGMDPAAVEKMHPDAMAEVCRKMDEKDAKAGMDDDKADGWMASKLDEEMPDDEESMEKYGEAWKKFGEFRRAFGERCAKKYGERFKKFSDGGDMYQGAKDAGYPADQAAAMAHKTLKDEGKDHKMSEGALTALIQKTVADALKKEVGSSISKLEKFDEELRREKRKELVEGVLDRLADRIPPGERDNERAVLELLADDASVHKFSEAGGKTWQGTRYQQRIKALEKRSPITAQRMKFAEAGGSAADDDVARVERFSESPILASALAAANKTPAKYVEDFKELRKKNPQLTATQYGVPANVA